MEGNVALSASFSNLVAIKETLLVLGARVLFFLLRISYICSQTPNAVHYKCGAALVRAERRRA